MTSASSLSGSPEVASSAVLDRWLLTNFDEAEDRLGLDRRRIQELRKSDEGRRDLLQRMVEADPSLNGEAEQVLEQLDDNIDQLEKKESFMTKVLKLPGRTVGAAMDTVRKHPILTGLGALGILAALLYFFGPAAPSVGAIATQGRELFREHVLKKIGLLVPDVGRDAAASLPVTGGLSDASAPLAESAGDLLSEQSQYIQGARIPSVAVEQIKDIADQVSSQPSLDGVNAVDRFIELLESAETPPSAR